MPDLIQHTTFCKPASMLETQWGLIPYAEWLEREGARIQSKGGVAEIRKAKDNHSVALFVESDERNIGDVE